MPVQIDSFKRPEWTPLPFDGCINVMSKALFQPQNSNISLAMLKFAENGTVHEHPADWLIEVCCLEGKGFTSVGGEVAAIKAGERVQWPAGIPHRLWTENSTMITLMIEHTSA